MPLPLAHSLAGAVVYKGLDADGRFIAWKRLLLAVVIAHLPDLDLIPGILVGERDLRRAGRGRRGPRGRGGGQELAHMV